MKVELTSQWLAKAKTPVEWLERAFEIKYRVYHGQADCQDPWIGRIYNYLVDSNECRDMFEVIPQVHEDNMSQCTFCIYGGS